MAKKETDTSGSKKKNIYFAKLPADHRKDERMERLIHRAGYEGYGIYMALLEMTVPNRGLLEFNHIEDTIEEQIAFDLRIDDVEKVRGNISTLEKLGLAERIEENPEEDDPGGLFLIEGEKYTAKECESAGRVRDYRKNKKEAEEVQALQCNGEALQSNDNKNKSKNENSELEQEARIRPLASNEVNSYSLGENPAAACAGAAGAAPPPPASSPFLEKIRKLNSKKKTHRLTEAGLEAFAKETNEGAELWGKPIEPDGLPKALNGWAKKMSEKGEHPEFFDDGAGQNAAAPDGAGQDHAGPDGTSAAPDRGSGGQAAPDGAAPDRAGSNEAGNSTSAETAAKEKALEKRIAELVKECKRIEATPTEPVQNYCDRPYSDDGDDGFGDCYNCEGSEKDGYCYRCAIGEFRGEWKYDEKFSDFAEEIFGVKNASFFVPVSYFKNQDEQPVATYLNKCHGVIFPKAGTILLDDPFQDLDSESFCEWDEESRNVLLRLLETYYSKKPFHGIPEAIARHELNMPAPCELEARRADKNLRPFLNSCGAKSWGIGPKSGPAGGWYRTYYEMTVIEQGQEKTRKYWYDYEQHEWQAEPLPEGPTDTNEGEQAK